MPTYTRDLEKGLLLERDRKAGNSGNGEKETRAEKKADGEKERPGSETGPRGTKGLLGEVGCFGISRRMFLGEMEVE